MSVFGSEASTPEWKCPACGARQLRWTAKCLACDAWGLEKVDAQEIELPAKASITDAKASITAPVPIAPIAMRTGAPPALISEIDAHAAIDRYSTGEAEFDRVLGGGIAPASIVLVGGDPGVGKSTLLIQALAHLAATRDVLYASGEETAEQVAARGRRVTNDTSRLSVIAETDIDQVIAWAYERRPQILVVDSIQTVRTQTVASAAGTVAQVRACAERCNAFARAAKCAVVMIGHVTKDGDLGGPKTLEHLVDVVLQLEASETGLRFLRARKNRHGSTSEIGIFEMRADGIAGVASPSAQLLADRLDEPIGSVVAATLDGSRPILVEIQALVTRTSAPGEDPPGRSVAVGVPASRLALIRAVMEKHTAIDLYGYDVFVSAAGGLRVNDTAADLAIAVAIASSRADRPVRRGAVTFGELGLTGDVRGVPMPLERTREAERMGFLSLVAPRASAIAMSSAPEVGKLGRLGNLDVIAHRELDDAIEAMLTEAPAAPAAETEAGVGPSPLDERPQ